MNRKSLFIALALGLAALGGAASAESLRTETEVRVLLTDEGFIDVANVQLENGMWVAEGIDATGAPVTLRIDPVSSKVVSEVREITAPATTVTRTTRITRTTTPAPAPEVIREVVEVPVPVTRASPMSADEATALLRAAGYHDIHDLSYRGGKWKAEAEDPSGDDREVHLDAFSGAIVHVEDD